MNVIAITCRSKCPYYAAIRQAIPQQDMCVLTVKQPVNILQYFFPQKGTTSPEVTKPAAAPFFDAKGTWRDVEAVMTALHAYGGLAFSNSMLSAYLWVQRAVPWLAYTGENWLCSTRVKHARGAFSPQNRIKVSLRSHRRRRELRRLCALQAARCFVKAYILQLMLRLLRHSSGNPVCVCVRTIADRNPLLLLLIGYFSSSPASLFFSEAKTHTLNFTLKLCLF